MRCVQRLVNEKGNTYQCRNTAVKEVQMVERCPKTDWWFALCPSCLERFKSIYTHPAWREREVA